MDNLKYLVNSNIVDSNIVTTLSNMINNKNRSQFSLNQIKDNKFQINPTNPQNVIIKGSHMIFDNGNEYNFDNTDVSYYATTPNLDKTKITDHNLIRRFYKDAKYDFNKPGDKKSNRYYYTRELENNVVESRGVIFFSKDPNELVDRLYLLYQEKIAGNDSKNINEEMVAIYDKLYSYSIISERRSLQNGWVFGLKTLYSFSLSLQIVYFSSSSQSVNFKITIFFIPCFST